MMYRYLSKKTLCWRLDRSIRTKKSASWTTSQASRIFSASRIWSNFLTARRHRWRHMLTSSQLYRHRWGARVTKISKCKDPIWATMHIGQETVWATSKWSQMQWTFSHLRESLSTRRWNSALKSQILQHRMLTQSSTHPRTMQVSRAYLRGMAVLSW